MNKLCIFSDAPAKAAAIRQQLGGVFDLHFLDLDRIHDVEPQQFLLFDINLRAGAPLLELKEWLKRKPKDGRIIVATDKTSHVQAIQAKALGATDILYHPLDGKTVINTILGDFESLANDDLSQPIRSSPGVGKAFEALENIFASALLGQPLDPVAINTAGEAVVRRIEAHGLGSWVDTVRKHHSQTYQHCLIVTGVATAFAQHLGLSRPDQLRLSFGAMLHDIGKARIPVAMLEKPTPLTADEMAAMRRHPEFGLEALKSSPDLHKDMLDIVVHHHEFLDGSGYPHGLRAGEIIDMVRIMTICDLFGALLERRAYRAPLTGGVAYQMLLDMGPKLDKDLVREFRFASALRLNHTA